MHQGRPGPLQAIDVASEQRVVTVSVRGPNQLPRFAMNLAA